MPKHTPNTDMKRKRRVFVNNTILFFFFCMICMDGLVLYIYTFFFNTLKKLFPITNCIAVKVTSAVSLDQVLFVFCAFVNMLIFKDLIFLYKD